MNCWCILFLALLMLPGAPMTHATGLFDDTISKGERDIAEGAIRAAGEALQALEMLELLYLVEQMQNGDCSPALEIEGKAKRGDPKSQWLLADLHRQGLCVPADPTAVARWLGAAAGQGYARAQFELGLAHLNGDGVPRSPTRAAQLLKSAFEGGVTDAGLRLATIYENGDGVPKSRGKAIEWLERAASGGNLDAAAQLALRHLQRVNNTPDPDAALRHALPIARKGHGLAQLVASLALAMKPGATTEDMIEAHKWANIASAVQQPELAAAAAKQRNAVEEYMTPEQVAEAERRVSSFEPSFDRDDSQPVSIALSEVSPRLADGLDPTTAKAELERLGVPITKDAFFEAVRTDNLGVFKLFHKAGADLETPWGVGRVTPLYITVDFGSQRIFDYLIASGANVNAADQGDGMMLLLRAIAHGRPQMIDRLLEAGATAKQNARMATAGRGVFAGETPFSYAIMIEDVDLVSRLFHHGASVEETYVFGETPLMRAAKEGNLDIFVELIKRGANPNATDELGNSILDHILERQPINTEILTIALKAGASAKRTADHLSPLAKAIIHGDSEAARILLDSGADPNARLHVSAEYIPISFTPQARDIAMNGGTALMLAAEFGHASVARVLVERGADRNIEAKVGGRTARAADIAKAHGNRLVLSVIDSER